MANKVLGGVTLPGTFTVSMPVDMPKQVEKAKMSDGSFRWAFFQVYRVWSLNWTKCTKAQLDVLIAREAVNAIQTWVNNDESATSYDVVVTNFSYDSVDPISTTKIYKANMTLEEAI